MKRKMQIIAVLGLLIALGTMQNRAYCTSELKEGIDVFVSSPTSSIFTVNVGIYFDLSQIPLNVSVFDSHLILAEYYTVPYGKNREVTNLRLKYSQGFDPNNPDRVVQEFLRVFNHESLSLLAATGPVADNNTSTTTFRYQFGYFPYNLQTMGDFLKYRLKTGFGSYVDKFLDLYVPGNGSTGVDGWYTLSKTSTGFSWELWITGSSSGVFSPGETAINLNQLLNNVGGSLSSDEYNASITVRPENQTYSTIYIKSVTPAPDYDDFQDGVRRFIWELYPNFELQNIVVNVKLSNTSDVTKGFPVETCIVILTVVLATTAIIMITIYRRRKKQEQQEQRELSQITRSSSE
jgi:hypothetical protein